jgi:hypothetical protein
METEEEGKSSARGVASSISMSPDKRGKGVGKERGGVPLN